MGDRDPLERIAEKYRRDGFDVQIRPAASDLPAFLANTPVDIIARKGDRVTALTVNEEGSSDEESIGVGAELGVDGAIRQIEEAELLLNPRTIRAALVMAWAAFEATARAVLQPGREAFAGVSPRQMVEELRKRGLISEDDYPKLQQSSYLRNAIVHGAWPDEVPPDLVPFLLGLGASCRRYLRHPNSLSGTTPR